jgi:ATP-dependent Lon protease
MDKFNPAIKKIDADHYRHRKAKKRILASPLKPADLKAPILVPVRPAAGKTSLGRNTANAMGRKYIRMSLGGVRDEAEICGHANLPLALRPAASLPRFKKSPELVIILDEIDKEDSASRPQFRPRSKCWTRANATFTRQLPEVNRTVLFIKCHGQLLDNHSARLRDRMWKSSTSPANLWKKSVDCPSTFWPK